MLRVAIVHYHLKRGGVTRVIESTLHGFDALQNKPQCVVLAGEVPDDFVLSQQSVAVEGLHYSNTQATTPTPQELLKRMRTAAQEQLGAAPDLWHIHNHSLGKNSAMPGVVSLLAEAGEAVLLHMHDFAEDGRPQNYKLNQSLPEFAGHIYPATPRVHYAVLNGRDHGIFSSTGLPIDQLHQLPNAVEAESSEFDSQASTDILNKLGAERLFLYPVRALRRKNFGEALLLSALAEHGDCVATTLGPTNKNYVPAHERWIDFAATHKLPMQFAIGQSHDFAFQAVMQTAEAILTTSITEGFGLAFLEPWLFGKPIIGRDLPAITADFKNKGIGLNALYNSLPIPKTWIDQKALEQSISTALKKVYRVYETPVPEDAVARAIQAISPDAESIDFGGLNEALQESVINRIVEDSSAQEALPVHTLRHSTTQEAIQVNAEQVRTHYGVNAYAERLQSLYTKIAATPATKPDFLSPKTILKAFLKPENFHLLKT